jgi:hypothetical protein
MVEAKPSIFTISFLQNSDAAMCAMRQRCVAFQKNAFWKSRNKTKPKPKERHK